jgi:hypothetical protein
MQDMSAKGRGTKNAGRIGETSGNAKVTTAMIRALRERRQAGASYSVLMREFGLSKSQVARIVRHQSWQHVK